MLRSKVSLFCNTECLHRGDGKPFCQGKINKKRHLIFKKKFYRVAFSYRDCFQRKNLVMAKNHHAS